MNQKYIWIGLAALTLIIGAVLIVNNQPSSTEVASTTQPTSEAVTENEPTMMDGSVDKMMSKDTASTNDAMMAKPGSYKDYSPSTVTAEQEAGNKVVLFFHAPWCPFCRTADAAFKNSAEKIPTGVTVLKIDYDSNSELKTKYGVTTQHTFVQIDNSGNLVTKWIGGDLDALQNNLK